MHPLHACMQPNPTAPCIPPPPDLTIMEEGTELLHRLEAKAAEAAGGSKSADPHAPSPVLPMFTSCCPGWVAMVEKSNPELIPFLSTCKSPQMMLGAGAAGRRMGWHACM
jgi:NADP-reducing hydrogenase subunit HndD